VDLLGPCGAFTESRRPLTSSSSLAGTAESESDIRPICRPIVTFLADCDADLNLRARGPSLRRAGESKTGKRPENAFHRIENLQAKTRRTCARRLIKNPRTRAPFRLLPIRAPRQAVLRTSSWLAPSVHRQALRPPGGEDARCVQPMSATHTNCVHPHLVRSRLALAACAAWTPHGV